MHNKHYSKQMEKRQRITERTLVLGMDIGSEFNAACCDRCLSLGKSCCRSQASC